MKEANENKKKPSSSPSDIKLSSRLVDMVNAKEFGSKTYIDMGENSGR